ncbi:CUB and zona pellucida-like domain-containing protein 1 [Holothuria leucospilota]|uniref:CUB and zona pellucida-like domain-containing protein 1 n=1 Tax=Holothuria leucospilota TaxID=206669 RepID=A0A9Q0YIF1_HOLLE|nr:CUB and zona pellucida-like domain-containing protein 1 [Holothuria leucospilota]
MGFNSLQRGKFPDRLQMTTKSVLVVTPPLLGCGINDAPVRVLTPYKQTQADFEITSFRFRKDLSHPESQIWIHCEVVVCDLSDANSECRQGCEQSRHRRSAKSPPLKTKRMVQGPIVLSSKHNDNSDIAAMSQNKDGSSGVLTAFLSAVSLIMMIGLVAMAVVLTKVISSSKQQGYQPLPNPSGENVA